MTAGKNPETRAYSSAIRAQQAAATRAAIVDAARTLFTSRGYAATSIDDVAAAAGVARRTVYLSVGSKRDLLLALLERMAPLSADRFATDLAAAAGDGPAQVALAVGFVCDLYEQGADVIELARGAGAADADLQELNQVGEASRLRSQRSTVEDWSARGLLRPGLSVRQAADVLWAMTSPSVYRLFVIDRRWSRRRFAAYLTEQLCRELFG